MKKTLATPMPSLKCDPYDDNNSNCFPEYPFNKIDNPKVCAVKYTDVSRASYNLLNYESVQAA